MKERARIRVLQVISSLGPGGPERFLIDTVRMLDQSMYEAHVCALQRRDVFPTRLKGHPIKLLNSNLRWSDPFDLATTVSALRREIRKFRPSVVHSHLWPASRAVGLALIGTKIPHVVHVHDCWTMAPTNLRNRLRAGIIDLILSREPTRFVAVSEHTRTLIQRHLGQSRGRTVVITNGTNVTKFRKREIEPDSKNGQGRLTIVSVGWLDYRKGQDILIESIAQLTERNFDIEVWFAGDNSKQSQFEELAKARGIADRVKFLGLVEDVAALLQHADVFVLASRDEEMPLVVLEAMATSLPVVASRVGGVAEIIDHGRTGLLFEISAPGALTDAIASLAASPGMRESLGNAARDAVVEHFSFTRTMRELEELYETLIEPSCRPAVTAPSERSAN